MGIEGLRQFLKTQFNKKNKQYEKYVNVSELKNLTISVDAALEIYTVFHGLKKQVLYSLDPPFDDFEDQIFPLIFESLMKIVVMLKSNRCNIIFVFESKNKESSEAKLEETKKRINRLDDRKEKYEIELEKYIDNLNVIESLSDSISESIYESDSLVSYEVENSDMNESDSGTRNNEINSNKVQNSENQDTDPDKIESDRDDENQNDKIQSIESNRTESNETDSNRDENNLNTNVDEILSKKDLTKLYSDSISPSRDLINKIRSCLIELGVPCVLVNCEGEKYCALLQKNNHVDLVFSKDTDCYAMGCRVIINEINIYKGKVRIVYLNKILRALKLTQDQFTDLCIMCGCDFNNKVKGLGPAGIFRMINTAIKSNTGYTDIRSLIGIEIPPNKYISRGTKFSESHIEDLKYDLCKEIFNLEDDINSNIIISSRSFHQLIDKSKSKSSNTSIYNCEDCNSILEKYINNIDMINSISSMYMKCMMIDRYS